MIHHPRPVSVLLLFCMAWFAEGLFGQSLSIVRKGEHEFSIEAAPPPDTQYVLQASGDLQGWVDVDDAVTGQISYRVDSSDATKRFFRLIPSPPPITLLLIGDSTVMDQTGWGTGIYGYFKPTVRVVNLAWPSLSTRTFLASEQLPKMRAIRPDYVLVQFGMVDATICGGDPDRCVTTLEEYAANLKTIVEIIRGFNGTPILITPPVGWAFDDSGKVIPAWEGRSAVVREVATDLQVHLIDLNQLSMDLYNELGESGSAYISTPDRYHYTSAGAQVIAGLIVDALPSALGPYLAGP